VPNLQPLNLRRDEAPVVHEDEDADALPDREAA
jgi:hypothetical protein